MSSSSKLKTDVDHLDNLVKDLLTEVNRPISDNNNNNVRYSYQRPFNHDLSNSTMSSSSTLAHAKRYDFDAPSTSKSIREERIRIKRGGSSNDIPVTRSSSSTMTATTATTPKPPVSASIDEHLIDSLLESVQNTLKKRAQRDQTNWPTDVPSNNRRTYSSSASYNTDSVHRMDLNRGRYPIKLNRTDSPTSTLSSKRHYNRDGYVSGSTTTIPTHFRATSEPPPDGPIELRRMDLIRSPSRTYVDPYLANEYYHYPRSALPSSGIRVRGYDCSGYDTDTGLMASRGYGPRYYRVPPPPVPVPMYPYYYHHPHESYRPILRPDGYDTDSGLISSGRLRMTRTLPPRMAVIPETVVVNNRMVPPTNLNQMPAHLRGSAFLNEINYSQNQTGYETDPGMNTRQYRTEYRQVPVDIQYGDSGWVGNQSMSRTNSQQQRFTDHNAHYRQPPPPQQQQQQHVRSTSIPVFSQHTEQRQHQQQQKKIPKTNVDHQTIKISTATPTFPVIHQSYNPNVQTRVGNSSLRNQDESSRRSSVSTPGESDAPRNGAYQAHNVSQFWYKEKMSREDAINLLKTKTPGTFLIRDSQGFPGSYGLAVKVEKLPSGIHSKPGADPNAELVRHYLIERTATGHVRLKGCPNEPDFPNLSALVYQHTLMSLALPTKLILPTADIAEDYRPVINQPQETKKMSIKELLEKGAACSVVYLNNIDVESLSGQMAVAKALRSTFDNAERLQPTTVNFKVSNTGITLTDTKKKLFSRRHFPKEYVTYCGADYETDRFWTYQFNDLETLPRAKCFGFVSKKINGPKTSQPENECHVFAELDPSQPSTAIVNFVSKVMIGSVPV